MGILRIQTEGSFLPHSKVFFAQHCGHGVAVDRAMNWLNIIRQEAILRDKALLEKGRAPEDNFAEARKRGLLE